MKKKILHVVGARPNFMKMASVYCNLNKYKGISQVIVHTGQHFDYNMSDVFFEQLDLPKPKINLGIKGGTVLSQIGRGILKIEEALLMQSPDLVCVYGDVNAAAFTSIAASQLGIKIAHIEAGLRSFDKSMPEETNRIITDTLSDYLFTHSEDGYINLINEGKNKSQIFFVGNVMIDSLKKFIHTKEVSFKFEVPEKYAMVTLHRPSNVDNKNTLNTLIAFLNIIGEQYKIILPLHPRTKANMDLKFKTKFKNIIFTDPLSYFEFISLEKNAQYVITDSGGVQEETTFLGVPCFTLRNNTERPITVSEGTNIIVGTDIPNLKSCLNDFFGGKIKKGRIPDLWDGNAGLRIANVIIELLGAKS